VIRRILIVWSNLGHLGIQSALFKFNFYRLPHLGSSRIGNDMILRVAYQSKTAFEGFGGPLSGILLEQRISILPCGIQMTVAFTVYQLKAVGQLFLGQADLVLGLALNLLQTFLDLFTATTQNKPTAEGSIFK